MSTKASNNNSAVGLAASLSHLEMKKLDSR